MGVDGIFVNVFDSLAEVPFVYNNVARLIALLREPTFAGKVRLAVRSDDPFRLPLRRAYVIRTVTGTRHGTGQGRPHPIEITYQGRWSKL